MLNAAARLVTGACCCDHIIPVTSVMAAALATSPSTRCVQDCGALTSFACGSGSRVPRGRLAFCWTLVVTHCGPTPMTCGRSCSCREHITNSVMGVSRPPVLDCGTTFHPDYGGWPLTFSDNLWNSIYLATEALSKSVEYVGSIQINLCFQSFDGVPSVLWRCWLGVRKGIQPVKNWVVECWCHYLSGVRCRLACGPADATATHCLLLL